MPPRLARQALRFGTIGVISTLAYLALFLLLRSATGAQPANLIALLVTTVANTAANRRYTFGVRGGGHGRHQLQAFAVFALGLALTSGALGLLELASAHPGRGVELAVLVGANLIATAMRFVLLREWVFARSNPS